MDTRDRPLRDLRISVTDRCNFRCAYCMPAEVFGEGYRFLPRKDILRFEEVLRVARLAVSLGVTKLRITGGEPLVRANLSELVAGLAAIPGLQDLALTTNGVLLPDQAGALAEAGLQRVTVSLDSLRPEVFKRTSGGRGEPGQVLAGIAAAEDAGLGPVKINCVVQRDVNQDDLVALARHFRGSGHILRFIEFMDVGTMNAWKLDQVVPAREILERIDAVLPLEPVDPNYDGEVARRYRYRDGSGEIGLIASVTEPFCGGCSRARLSAEGEFVTCLFSRGGRDLKAPLRSGVSDTTLSQMIAGTWTKREDRYSEERSGKAGPRKAGERIEMYRIGG
ncbi:MAG: GTP 3',8-cyclase MoaA [bacterium]|nr:GTP 3',8-cyclase MoaA [bacterium]